MSETKTLKLPFNISSIKEVIKNNEHGLGGYYPFGSWQLWHAGIHIHKKEEEKKNDEKEEIIEAFIPGEIVAYKLCSESEKADLPKILWDDNMKSRFSKYLDLYESKTQKVNKIVTDNNGDNNSTRYKEVIENFYELKKDLPEEQKKYDVPNGFILLKHEFNIKELEKPLIFYSFYMNLAAKTEIKEDIYNKFTCDGQTHFVEPKMRFEVTKIGKAGLYENDRHIDFAIIQKESLFNNKFNKKLPASERRTIFYSGENLENIYTREDENIESVKSFIPKLSSLDVIDEVVSGSKVAKKLQFKTIAVYLPSAAIPNPKVGETRKLAIDVSSIWIVDLKVTSTTKDNFPAIEAVKQYLQTELKMDKEFVVRGTTTDKKQALICIDIGNTPAFWIINDNSININVGKGDSYVSDNAIKNISIYSDCPIYSKFTETKEIEKTEITGFSDYYYVDKDNNKYNEILNKKGFFVKQEEIEKCMVCPFEWDKFFYDETDIEDSGIICNRTYFFTKYDKSKLLKDLYMANAEHDFITEDELNMVYGNKGDFPGAADLREEIRKIVCKHPIEFDESIFDNISKESSKHKDWGCHIIRKEDFDNSLKTSDVWKNGLQKEFKKNKLFFVHPLYFLSHLQKSGVLEINPYKDFSFKDIHGGDLGKNVDFTNTVIDNPGFAPVWKNTGKAPNPNTNGFAAITGFFNEDYASETMYTDYDNYYHEGVDFRGDVGTDIVSFIYGKVLAYGYFEAYGRTIFIRDINSNGIYLLAHLQSYNKTVLDKGIVEPGDIVGYVGTSGNYHSDRTVDGVFQPAGHDSQYVAHLHISFYALDDNTVKKIYVYKNGENIQATSNYTTDFTNTRRDCFRHNSNPKSTNKLKKKQ